MTYSFQDLVSIVMPAYRAELFISESINSVINQSYLDWELIIVDDCSPDGTGLLVDSFVAREPRIKLIRASANGGPAVSRNLAINKAKGRWIAFLDSDDVWLPTKLAETLEFAKLNNSALTFTGYRRMSSDASSMGHFISVPVTLGYEDLLGNTSTVLIDRLKTGPFNMKNAYYDDFVCWLEILKKGFVAHGLNKDLMRYRVVVGSVSRNKMRSAFEVWKTYRNIESLGFAMSVKSFLAYSLNSISKYRNF